MKALWITLGVLGGILLLCLAGGYGFYRWLASHKGEIVAVGSQAKADAALFATQHEQRDCVGESIRRADGCDGIVCETGCRIFLDQCLVAARPSPRLCAGVPSSHEIIDSARWAIGACEGLGAVDEQRCGRVIRSLAEHCDRERASAK